MMATWYRRLLDLCGLLAGACFAVIAVATAYDVFMRNVYGESLRGLIDLVEYGLFIATFIAAPWVLRVGGHVRVDFMVNALPPPLQRAAGFLADLMGMSISVVLLVWSIRVTIGAWQQGNMVLKAVVFPEWWIFVVMPFSAALLTIEFAIRLTQRRPASDVPGF